jgi:ribosomal protein S18 acetylase RimI-like enzyme
VIVGRLTPADYSTILEEHASFWGERDLRPAHHPVLVHELGDTSLALREHDRLVGYLFGFVVAQTQVGYVHLIGVRESHRRHGLATRLWAEFERIARARGAHTLKAITTPANEMSIGFHRSMGMEVERVADYAGPGQDRIVFTRELDGGPADLDHVLVAVPAGATPQVRDFYGGALGLAELEVPESLGRLGAWFALAGRQLHVLEYDDFAPAARAHPALRVGQSQLDAMAERLAATGATVAWDDRLSDRRRFYTYDPWGNRVEVLAYGDDRSAT